jgi:hypothetical protein
MSDIRKTWSVIEVGPNLQTSTNRFAFDVMKVEDHEEAVDALVEKAADAVKKWRTEAIAAKDEVVRLKAIIESRFPVPA